MNVRLILSIRHHYGLLKPSYGAQIVTITTHMNLIYRIRSSFGI